MATGKPGDVAQPSKRLLDRLMSSITGSANQPPSAAGLQGLESGPGGEASSLTLVQRREVTGEDNDARDGSDGRRPNFIGPHGYGPQRDGSVRQSVY